MIFGIQSANSLKISPSQSMKKREETITTKAKTIEKTINPIEIGTETREIIRIIVIMIDETIGTIRKRNMRKRRSQMMLITVEI